MTNIKKMPFKKIKSKKNALPFFKKKTLLASFLNKNASFSAKRAKSYKMVEKFLNNRHEPISLY